MIVTVAGTAEGDCRLRMGSVTPRESALAGGRRRYGEMAGSWVNRNGHSGMMTTVVPKCRKS